MTRTLPFCAIDFETTGSVSGYPVEPWQVGVTRWDLSGEPVFWESLLRVGPRPFHPRAPGRHAVLRRELERSPTLVDRLPNLREYCSGVPLVAHNIGTEKKCLRDAVPMESFGPWIDTLKLARCAWPEAPSHSLENLLDLLGLAERVNALLPGREAHDALYDALASAVLLRHLLAQPGWQNVSLQVLLNPDLSEFYRRGR